MGSVKMRIEQAAGPAVHHQREAAEDGVDEGVARFRVQGFPGAGAREVLAVGDG